MGFVAWFAGIFYIWRLFVYHSEATSTEVKSTLAIMERKLYKYIMRPAMVITLFCGIMMLILQWNVLYSTYWIWLKISAVFILVFQHFLADYYRIKLLEGKIYASRKFRFLNELPTLLLILIVILAVLKPF